MSTVHLWYSPVISPLSTGSHGALEELKRYEKHVCTIPVQEIDGHKKHHNNNLSMMSIT